MAEVPNRDAHERELQQVVLALWLLFDDTDLRSSSGRAAFYAAFDRLIRPVIAAVYANARVSLAENHGYTYKPATEPQSAPVAVEIPGLEPRIRAYADDLYDRFKSRQSDERSKGRAGTEYTPYGESDAEREAITSLTDIQSTAEIDARDDIAEAELVELVGIWRTEPGACKVCSPLEGTTERVWGKKFPMGTPAHPNCRCVIEWMESSRKPPKKSRKRRKKDRNKVELGTVVISGKERPLQAEIVRPDEIMWRAIDSNRFEVNVSAPGFAGGDKFGGISFFVSRKNKTARVEYINSSPVVKGQGVGNRLYAEAMLIAKEEGVERFNSDRRVSHEAVRSWESLRSKLPEGAVVRVDEATREPNQMVSKEPLFQVDLSQVSEKVLRQIAGL